MEGEGTHETRRRGVEVGQEKVMIDDDGQCN
jgi:hypothetical protein